MNSTLDDLSPGDKVALYRNDLVEERKIEKITGSIRKTITVAGLKFRSNGSCITAGYDRPYIQPLNDSNRQQIQHSQHYRQYLQHRIHLNQLDIKSQSSETIQAITTHLIAILELVKK